MLYFASSLAIGLVVLLLRSIIAGADSFFNLGRLDKPFLQRAHESADPGYALWTAALVNDYVN